MNFKRLRKLVTLAVAPLILASSNHIALAGGEFSKSATVKKTTANQELYIKTVSVPSNFPLYAADGGKAYYNAWYNLGDLGDSGVFEQFLEKYSDIIDNETSATKLKDSTKDCMWQSLHPYGNAFELLSMEQPDSVDSSKFLIRVDVENRIIYTIRKSGDEYLCKFYVACRHTGETNVLVFAVCNWILNNTSAVKNILLPVDRALLD